MLWKDFQILISEASNDVILNLNAELSGFELSNDEISHCLVSCLVSSLLKIKE